MHHRRRRLAVLAVLIAGGIVPAARSGAATGLDGLPASGASAAPDGFRVVFSRKTASGWRLYTANRNGSGLKALTAGPRDDLEPSWRADGAAIVFASNRGGNFDLYSIHPDGSGLRQLTRTPQDERFPQWSPRPFALLKPSDNNGHAVLNRPKKGLGLGELQLLHLLATKDSDWEDYKFRFDLKNLGHYYKLLFVEGSGDKQRIGTMREDGMLRQRLDTGMTGAHYNPVWSRTAESIAFLRRIGGQSAIYTADYATTTDLNQDEKHTKFGIELKEWRRSIHRVGQMPVTAFGFTPNGAYLVAVSGRALHLLPLPNSGLAAQTVAIGANDIAAAPIGWQSDARTALLTVRGANGPVLHRLRLAEPLLDIVNLADHSGDLDKRDYPLLRRNGFVAGGEPSHQMFQVYEETDYANLPIFVTTDSVLHLNHLVFDYLLRGVETQHLMPDVLTMVNHYLSVSLQQAKSANGNAATAGAARANAAFFAVAARLALGAVTTGKMELTTSPKDDVLGVDRDALHAKTMRAQNALLAKWTAPLQATLKQLTPAIDAQVRAELKLIGAHGGLEESPIFGGALTGVGDPTEPLQDTRIDYGDFLPRGHYTRSEILRRYFLTTHWLSGAPFRRGADGVRRALLIVAATDKATRDRLDKAISVVSAFVGGADDADIASYAGLWQKTNGSAPTLHSVADSGKMKAFLAAVETLPMPKIAPSRGAAFRVWPQPYTVDGEIMQSLIYDRNPPDVGTEDQPRYFALGLDVMGVLGSDRARQILDNTKFQGTFFDFDLKETQYENYDQQFKRWRGNVAAMGVPEWDHNLYTRTLQALRPLLKPAKSRFAFTKTQAWTDKNLNTALATWAELKHDTMPKMPVAIEAGGEGGISEAPVWEQPRGFVEPAPEVFARLDDLVNAENVALMHAGYLTSEFGQRLEAYRSLLVMLSKLERKQAAGQALTPQEVEQLRFYGAYQEHLTMVTLEGEGGSMEGNDMAIIADVSSAYSTVLKQQLVLQEGVGRALPVYVAVERNGRRELACGAVFSYFEFTHPADDRLTDEKWRGLLDTPAAPKAPAWTSSFISRLKSE